MKQRAMPLALLLCASACEDTLPLELMTAEQPLRAALAVSGDTAAAESFRLLAAARDDQGSTRLTLGWDPPSELVEALRVERSTAAEGPWEEVATLSPAETLFELEQPATVAAFYRLVEVGGGASVASAPLRALSVAALEYHLEAQDVPGIPFPTSLFGVVRYPEALDEGPFPLVVLLHGNHENCRDPLTLDEQCVTQTAETCGEGLDTVPNAFGYTYLQDTLAAQGFVTVSVGANALNCRNDGVDGFITERAKLLVEHLRRWSLWSSGDEAPFGPLFSGRVDMQRVSLFGHSRGATAVSRMSTELQQTPVAGVSLASLFALAPPDDGSPNPDGVRFATLLPGCDADIPGLEGAAIYERAIEDLGPDPHAQVLIVGANHNFFNTEWRIDENELVDERDVVCRPDQQIGATAQRATLQTILSDWVLRASTGASLPDYMRADADTPRVIEDAAEAELDLRWSYAAPERFIIDNFSQSDPDFNDLGGANTYEGFTRVDWFGNCGSRCFFLPSRQNAPRLVWNGAATARFDLLGLDATDFATLSLRFAASPQASSIDPGSTEHDFTIALSDDAGHRASLSLREVGRLPHGYPTATNPREVFSTVRVPLAELLEREPALNLSALRALELVMPGPGSSIGAVWLADFELVNE